MKAFKILVSNDFESGFWRIRLAWVQYYIFLKKAIFFFHETGSIGLCFEKLNCSCLTVQAQHITRVRQLKCVIYQVKCTRYHVRCARHHVKTVWNGCKVQNFLFIKDKYIYINFIDVHPSHASFLILAMRDTCKSNDY